KQLLPCACAAADDDVAGTGCGGPSAAERGNSGGGDWEYAAQLYQRCDGGVAVSGIRDDGRCADGGASLQRAGQSDGRGIWPGERWIAAGGDALRRIVCVRTGPVAGAGDGGV